MQDPQVTEVLHQCFITNQIISRCLLRFKLPAGGGEAFESSWQESLLQDYQTRKELLVLVYYLMEFADTRLFSEALAIWQSETQQSTEGALPVVLSAVVDVINVYH